MRKFIFFAILFSCFADHVCAQVNLQTGAAQFQLPIFSFEDQNRLSTDISLNYVDGNGLKVDEIASEVGTGWVLQAGGVIVRNQKGLPDDQRRAQSLSNPLSVNQSMTASEYLTKYYPNGYLFSAYNPSDIITNEGAYVRSGYIYPQSTLVAPEKEFFTADREQDIFTINYGKGVVNFVIEKNLQVTILDGSRVKVEPVFAEMLDRQIKTTISSFIVTDITGIKYIFSRQELSQTCTYDETRFPIDANYEINPDEFASNEPPYAHIVYPGQNPSSPNTLPAPYAHIGKRSGSYVINKWYLSEVQNPLTGKKIQFTYEDFDCEMVTGKTMNFSKSTSFTISKEILKTTRLTNISLPEGKSVILLYDNVGRADVPAKKPLKEIIMKDNDVVQKKFAFNYQYFFNNEDANGYWTELQPYNTTFTDRQKFFTRLCLSSVQIMGGDGITNLPPYQFQYFINDPGYLSSVPPMFSVVTDHWGYNNQSGQIRSSLLWGYYLYHQLGPNQLLPFPVIKQECENPNQNKQPAAGLAKFGILKQVTLPTAGALSFEYEQNTARYNSQNIMTGGVRVNRFLQYDGVSHANDIIKEIKYTEDDGISSSGWGYEPQQYSQTLTQTVYAQANTNLIKSVARDFASNVISSTLTGTFKNQIPVGKAFSSSIKSSLIIAIAQIIIALFSSSPNTVTETATEYRNFSFQQQNLLPAQYRRVEIIEKNGLLTNGKTVFAYTSDQDQPLFQPQLTVPFVHSVRYADSYYGLPKKVSVYDKDQFLLKETTNEYLLTYYLGSSCKEWVPNLSVYNVYPPPTSMTSYLQANNNISVNEYNNILNRTNLLQSTDKIFSKINPGVFESTTSYNYNPVNKQIQNRTVKNSLGKFITEKYFYPEDYNLSQLPILQALVNSNIVAAPVSIEKWQTTPGGSSHILSATSFEYGVTPGGDIKPWKTYLLQTAKPLSELEIGSFNPNNVIRNSNYVKPIAEDFYDINGNLIQKKKIPGNEISVVILNESNLPIASVINASMIEVAYTSFEDFSGSSGNILIFPQILTEPCPTGNKCGNLGIGQELKFSISTTRESVLTLWATTSSLLINGNVAVPEVTGETINGWTFYSYAIPVNSPVISLAGNCKIDEVRLYPRNARMVTMCYEPAIGKTTECDINNRISYYSYDGLGRLTLVRDAYKNIIKKICYNSAGQTESCPLQTSTVPNWIATGNTRCRSEICSSNNNYTYYISEKEERDMNPNSTTAGSYHWIPNPGALCPTVADWQPRNDLSYCEEFPTHTGNRITPTYDANPCSSTFNQWGLDIVVPNAPECAVCFPACAAPEYKCINGICVQGEWKVVKTVRIDKFTWQCTRAWCFPDGSVDTINTQTTTGSTSCSIECF